jgi:glutamyl-Q tRNA(Asp) synthetase
MTLSPGRPILRFAPTPNGRLHLGHAYSALLNERTKQALGGRLLIRMEDLDRTRCKDEYAKAILEDIGWLGVAFETPIRRQSEHADDYRRAYQRLEAQGVLYPCFCTRNEIETASRAAGLGLDPDGAPLYTGRCRTSARRPTTEPAPTLRLDVARALDLAPANLFWREFGETDRERLEPADPSAWGDVALKRRGALATYHVAVVVDDARQGVTDVVRGRDLFHATGLHRLLQVLLGFEAPRYRHHRLVLDTAGEKMSKSASSTPLLSLRRQGLTPSQVRDTLGLGQSPAPARMAARLS